MIKDREPTFANLILLTMEQETPVIIAWGIL